MQFQNGNSVLKDFSESTANSKPVPRDALGTNLRKGRGLSFHKGIAQFDGFNNGREVPQLSGPAQAAEDPVGTCRHLLLCVGALQCRRVTSSAFLLMLTSFRMQRCLKGIITLFLCVLKWTSLECLLLAMLSDELTASLDFVVPQRMDNLSDSGHLCTDFV